MKKLLKQIALIGFIAPIALATSAKASEDHQPMFHFLRLQVDGADNRKGGLVNWEGQGWIGGDTDKFVLRSEGEMQNGHVERSEVWALWSHMISPYWDVQAGIRQDIDPRPISAVAFGFQGLMPQFLETDAHMFVSTHGVASARLEQTIDLPITQRLILQPHIKADIYARDVPQLDIGSGISRIEAGTQLRYEFTRKFAPYVDLVYETATGNTARIKRANGEKAGELTLRIGLRVGF